MTNRNEIDYAAGMEMTPISRPPIIVLKIIGRPPMTFTRG